VSEPVRLTVVANEGAAEILCQMLRTEGIRCAHRQTNVGSGAADAGWSFGGWREVLVSEDDLDRARELFSADPA
jgi:hypothetical protein